MDQLVTTDDLARQKDLSFSQTGVRRMSFGKDLPISWNW
jgi:hypothetical protein